MLRIIKEQDFQRYKLGGQLSEWAIQVWPLGPGRKDQRELGRASTGETEVQSGKSAAAEMRPAQSLREAGREGQAMGKSCWRQRMNAKASMWRSMGSSPGNRHSLSSAGFLASSSAKRLP